jgi:flagellar basal body-associated protein FliL
MNTFIIRIVTIFVFFVVQIVSAAFVFSVTKNADNEREIGRAESADGRVQVGLIVTPLKPRRLSDTIILRLEIVSDNTVRTELPEFGEFIGTLKIVGTSEDVSPVLTGKEKRTLEIKTTPTQAGITPIWPIAITYYDRLSDSNDKKDVVELRSASLEIESDVAANSASLDGLISDYELFQIERNSLLWIILSTVLGLSVLVIFLFWFLKRKKKTEPELELSPQQIALRRIAELIERRLHEVDVKLFFVELSGIVRWYIEQQTSIRVPELTTEEFLQEISQNIQTKKLIPNDLIASLKLFLESADMVKFAKFKPNQEEILQGIKYAQTLFHIEWKKDIVEENL